MDYNTYHNKILTDENMMETISMVVAIIHFTFIMTICLYLILIVSNGTGITNSNLCLLKKEMLYFGQEKTVFHN